MTILRSHGIVGPGFWGELKAVLLVGLGRFWIDEKTSYSFESLDPHGEPLFRLVMDWPHPIY